MSRLRKTLYKLKNEKPIVRKEVVILFAPALTEKRFQKEKKRKWWNFGQLEKEFVSLQTRYDDSWETFKDNITIPICSILKPITKVYGIEVLLNASIKDFKRVFQNGDYKLVILVAHHIKNDKYEAIEFADKPFEINKFINFLTTDNEKSAKSLISIVCDSNTYSKKLYEHTELQSIAWASWKMPLLEGMKFCLMLVKHLDGINTLSNAYDETIRELIYTIEDEE